MFGIVSKKQKTGSTRYKVAGSTSNGQANKNSNYQQKKTKQEIMWEQLTVRDQIDQKMGFSKFDGSEGSKLGYLINIQSSMYNDPTIPDASGREAVDFYFLCEDGSTFKATLVESPYFFVACRAKTEIEVESYLKKTFPQIEKTFRIEKEDLDLSNHLVGNRRIYVKLVFRNVSDLLDVRKVLMQAVKKNSLTSNAQDAYLMLNQNQIHDEDDDVPLSKNSGNIESLSHIVDIREYDVPFVTRVCIDKDYRVGLWYNVSDQNGQVLIERQFDKLIPADPIVFAFDIETSKAPLKFPVAEIDQIMMISYMVNGQGYLITNREIVSEDIEDFNYSPSDEFQGPFTIFNEASEKDLLVQFFEHIRILKPQVFVTYNGDFFDWPFIETRAAQYGLDMYVEIGFMKNDQGEYFSQYASHMDCLKWVKRDSYLPVGSQGLKAVTKAKLGYDPKEIDPELMTPYAYEQPQLLADYSVSDAVATYYLYIKYVHPFIFSLCMIIPLNPDDVLRKGSGTLCEMLLMVEAYKANVIMPNKHQDDRGKTFEGHLLSSETYVGGHVEALESGVFRSDIPTHFKVDPQTLQKLIDDLDRALKFSLVIENKINLEDVSNYADIKLSIEQKLTELKVRPNRFESPLIYHLDVAAMYPNIILTNRLQPPALVDESDCAACDFYNPENNCQRKMKWSWRGEYYPADRSELNMVKNQLESELFKPNKPDEPWRKWSDLSESEQTAMIHKRIADYSRKIYHRVKEEKVIEKESIVCQRENSFYVDTVRNFRDRRYEYKGKLKVWKKNYDNALENNEAIKVDEAKKMVVLMDSLQLAHKCILNSFYGYVMRKGSRWYSMEMAGIVCLTGANIIQLARKIVEKIGRPLELDTDGIWCILPASFPENFTFTLNNGKKIHISYPCVMLNHLVHDEFTNDQYQTLIDPQNYEYQTSSENSIFFEVDGPYRAMILPASKEENKLLKKRYAVFNDDGSLAELKGFEMKRRGELKIIKIFQEEVFHEFLKGDSLTECYQHVSKVANRWLDVLFSRGKSISDEELLEYISENRSMSKTLEDYGSQKSTSISTAKRLAEFLGDEMVKDKGLACKFIISQKPIGAPVAERAIPVAIFSAEQSVARSYLRKWLNDKSLVNIDLRDILDWQYYIERLGSTVQKLITIPAAMQKVSNPVPRLIHPDWLLKQKQKANDFKQNKITDIFSRTDKQSHLEEVSSAKNKTNDIEDYAQNMPKSVTKSIKSKNSATTELKLPDTLPDPDEDFEGFMRYQKIKWQLQKQRRIARKNGQTITHNDLDKSSGIQQFMQNSQKSLLYDTWTILQILPTDTLGVYSVWALVGQQLLNLSLTVPRQFFVNTRYPDPQQRLQKSSKVLPRSLKALNLYEVVTDEKSYLNDGACYKLFASHPDTLGVFETQISLQARTILELGSFVKLNIKSTELSQRHRNNYDLCNFDPTDYDIKDAISLAEVKIVYLYVTQQENLGLISVFNPHTRQSEVMAVEPFKSSLMPNLNNLYVNKLVQIGQDALEDIYPSVDQMQFSYNYIANFKDAYKKLGSHLKNQATQLKRNMMVLVQSSIGLEQLQSSVPSLKQYPCIEIQCNGVGTNYPSLNWLAFACKRMIQSYVDSIDWISDRMALSNYSKIPLGCFDEDPIIQSMDYQYGRILQSHDLILWYSPSCRPDLGGIESDDNFAALKEFEQFELNYSSFYDTICIEYKIKNLCINSVLQSTAINEYEGAHAYAGLSNSNMLSIDEHLERLKTHDDNQYDQQDYDQNMPSFVAYKCLKEMLRNWAKDYLLSGNPVSQVFLKNFHRWISSPQSKLYDPALHGYLHSLMIKALLQLLHEFQKLGAKVIYATFDKIVIVTTKKSYKNAKVWSDFIVQNIMEKDMFAALEINDDFYWESLIWMDKLNYGGLCLIRQEQGLDLEDFQLVPTAEWGIKRQLPAIAQNQFDNFIMEFVKMAKDVKEEIKNTFASQEMSNSTDNKNDTMKALTSTHIKNLIKEVFTPKLLDIVSGLQQISHGMLTDDEMKDFRFPVLPGCSSSQRKSITLELIKSICHVLSLSPIIKDEIRIMKKNALNLIGVREFSDEAQFDQSECKSLKLSDMTCESCQTTKDFDLLQDSEIIEKFIELKELGIKRNQFDPIIHCQECGNQFENNLIEAKLVDMVQKSLMSYQLRDLKCTKCSSLKDEFLRSNCRVCANQFEVVYVNNLSGVVSKTFKHSKNGKSMDEDISVRRIHKINSVGKYYDFSYLQEVCEYTLNLIQ